MKKNTRKGFTITELVIVIAVIAILAAVLIPTFSGIIGKASDSADLQEARNDYTNYMIDHAEDGVANLIIQGGDNFFAVVNGQLSDTVYASSDAAKAAFTAPSGKTVSVGTADTAGVAVVSFVTGG